MNKELYFKEKTGENFNKFYKSYNPKLVWFLMTICKDEELAKDMANETFLKIMDNRVLDGYDKEKGQLSTWLFTIARRDMLQYIKKVSKNQVESIDKDHNGLTILDVLESKDSNDIVEKELILEKKVEIIKNKIKQLDDKYSTVLTMREIDQLAYQEISDLLNINLSTVKSQIRQGRKLLVKKVQNDFKELESQGVSTY